MKLSESWWAASYIHTCCSRLLGCFGLFFVWGRSTWEPWRNLNREYKNCLIFCISQNRLNFRGVKHQRCGFCSCCVAVLACALCPSLQDPSDSSLCLGRCLSCGRGLRAIVKHWLALKIAAQVTCYLSHFNARESHKVKSYIREVWEVQSYRGRSSKYLWTVIIYLIHFRKRLKHYIVENKCMKTVDNGFMFGYVTCELSLGYWGRDVG